MSDAVLTRQFLALMRGHCARLGVALADDRLPILATTMGISVGPERTAGSGAGPALVQLAQHAACHLDGPPRHWAVRRVATPRNVDYALSPVDDVEP